MVSICSCDWIRKLLKANGWWSQDRLRMTYIPRLSFSGATKTASCMGYEKEGASGL
jgi:hypothetical protein